MYNKNASGFYLSWFFRYNRLEDLYKMATEVGPQEQKRAWKLYRRSSKYMSATGKSQVDICQWLWKHRRRMIPTIAVGSHHYLQLGREMLIPVDVFDRLLKDPAQYPHFELPINDFQLMKRCRCFWPKKGKSQDLRQRDWTVKWDDTMSACHSDSDSSE